MLQHATPTFERMVSTTEISKIRLGQNVATLRYFVALTDKHIQNQALYEESFSLCTWFVKFTILGVNIACAENLWLKRCCDDNDVGYDDIYVINVNDSMMKEKKRKRRR